MTIYDAIKLTNSEGSNQAKTLNKRELHSVWLYDICYKNVINGTKTLKEIQLTESRKKDQTRKTQTSNKNTFLQIKQFT